MNKITKGLLAGAVVVSLFATMGCGGGDKKKEDPKPATTTTQKQDKAPEVKQTKVKPVPKSSMYRYALHLDDVNKLPPMTDEVIKEFEKQAKPIKIAEKDPKKHRSGTWTFNSAPQKKVRRFIPIAGLRNWMGITTASLKMTKAKRSTNSTLPTST